MGTKPLTLSDKEQLEILEQLELIATEELQWDFMAVTDESTIPCIVMGTEEWVAKIVAFLQNSEVTETKDRSNLH